MATLAIAGGRPIRPESFPRYNTIGEDEKRAAMEVLDTGVLSQFLGEHHPDFFGGPRVQELERDWAQYLGVRHAVSVNSATSGLYAAIGAAGVSPGDEVIVTPYTMTASASGILVYNAIPVFADIDPDYFCLDIESIRSRLTPYTRAIMVVHLFGNVADMDPIMDIAREHNLVVIEDAAQAPGASYHGRPAGTIGHMGVFSLNCHKTIQTGEGGVVVTNDDDLALRLQLIRNHGEVVVGKMGVANIANTLGWNYRITELSAAIGTVQLRKLESLTATRIELANYLGERLDDVPGITPPAQREGVRHVFYVYPMKYDEDVSGIPRDLFVKAVIAEGLPLSGGYVRPIYLEPMYQERIVYGSEGCPFTCSHYKGSVDYSKGICPVTERMHERELIHTGAIYPPLTCDDMEDMIQAFKKVLDNRKELLEFAENG